MAVVVLFSGALGRRLGGWRREYDPVGADRLPPHIMLSSPFVAEPPFLPLERHLWRVCHGFPPVTLELGALRCDRSPGRHIYVDVGSGADELAALRDALHTGPLARLRDEPAPPPRVVIAEPGSDAALESAYRQLLAMHEPASYEVDRVWLMTQQPDGSWYARDYFTLDAGYGVRAAGGA